MKKLKSIGYWAVSLTWGLPLTLYGAVVSVGLMIAGYKPKRFHDLIYFEVGENWGGFNAGPFFFVSKGVSIHTMRHEAGHGLQNIMFGFLTPFAVTLPSTIRYHYRNYLVRSGKKKAWELPSYDSIWFEGMATRLGEKYYK